MKKNLGTFFGLPRWGVGAALLALCAFTPVSRADVIVDTTTPGGDATLTHLGGAMVAQLFTMSGTSGNLNSLTLELFSSAAGTVNVNLYATLAGAPTGLATLLGTVTTAGTGDSQLVGVSSLNNVTLLAGTQYAIALGQSASVEWDYTSTGGVGPIYNSANGGSTWTPDGLSGSMQMNLQTTPVPEVPITGVVMGFGALAIAVGGTLRRKLRPAVSNIA